MEWVLAVKKKIFESVENYDFEAKVYKERKNWFLKFKAESGKVELEVGSVH